MPHLRIAFVNPFYDRGIASGSELISRYRHLAQLSEALKRRRHEIFVVQAFHSNVTIKTDDAIYRLVRAPHRGTLRLSGALPSSTRGFDRLVAAVAEAKPEIVHMNGLTLLQPLSALGEWCADAGRPLTVSHHGGRPLRLPWLRPWQKRVLARVYRVFLTSTVHADPWISAGLLQPEQIVSCMEVSSTFTRQPRDVARRRTGMHGSPVFAWNGRLHRIKDPLTALKGFSRIRRQWPDARLYMIYLTDELRQPVRDAIATDPYLRESVELRGRIPHAEVENFLNSADFFLLSSIHEGGNNYAVMEAMSCGAIPVLSDIPSFRADTGNGEYGLLFPRGEPIALAARVLAFDRGNIEEMSQTIRNFFLRSLSYGRIAEIYEEVFQSACSRRSGGRH